MSRNRVWALARAASAEPWVWAHPQTIRGIAERILRSEIGDENAERLLHDAAAAAAARAEERMTQSQGVKKTP